MATLRRPPAADPDPTEPVFAEMGGDVICHRCHTRHGPGTCPPASIRFADLKVYPGGMAHDDPRSSMFRAPASVPLPVDPDTAAEKIIIPRNNENDDQDHP